MSSQTPNDNNKAIIKDQLANYLEQFPEINNITVYNSSREEWLTVDSKEDDSAFWAFILPDSSTYERQLAPMASSNLGDIFFFSLETKRGYIGSNFQETVINFITIIVISGLVLFELLIFLFSRSIELISFSRKEEDVSKSISVRILAFMTIFSIDMVISFLPLYVDNLYTGPVFGFLGKDFFRPLPIVSELFFATIAISLSKKFLDNRGWQYPIIAGMLLIIVGNLFSYLSNNIPIFILSRGITGFGYGLGYIAFNSYIASHTQKGKRSQSVAHLGAALAAGTIGGGLIGGIFADYFGRQLVFLITIVPIVLLLLWVFLVMNKDFSYVDSLSRRKKFAKNEVWRFISSPSIWPNLFLLSFPFAILFVGFTQYSVPVYLGDRGYSNADIARAITFYGFLSIILLPLVGKWVDKMRFSYPILGMSAFITTASFFVFSFTEGYGAIILGLGIFALGAALSEVSRPVYLLEQDISQKIGHASALSVLSTVERIGQFMGPLAFRIASIFVGLQHSFVAVGVIVGLMYLAFFIKSKPSYYRRVAKQDQNI